MVTHQHAPETMPGRQAPGAEHRCRIRDTVEAALKGCDSIYSRASKASQRS